MSTPDIRAALDAAEQHATAEVWADHPLAIILAALIKQTRAALVAEPVGEGPSDEEWDALVERIWDKYETVGHQGERFMYASDFDNALDLVRKELPHWGRPATPATPETPAGALAARPLLEQMARLQHSHHSNPWGQMLTLSSRAVAWLRDNPPGQPVAIEPRGCPAPGACACVEPAPAVPMEGEVGELVAMLRRHAHWMRVEAIAPIFAERADRIDRAATLLQQQQAAPAPVVVPVAIARFEFEVLDEHDQTVASGDASTLEEAAREGRHYLGQYEKDGPCTLELRRVDVLDSDAIPLPRGGEVEG